jgi:hypothetical protein
MTVSIRPIVGVAAAVRWVNAPDEDEARESVAHGEHESYLRKNPDRLLELRTGQLWAVHSPGRLAEAETLGYVADWGQHRAVTSLPAYRKRTAASGG